MLVVAASHEFSSVNKETKGITNLLIMDFSNIEHEWPIRNENPINSNRSSLRISRNFLLECVDFMMLMRVGLDGASIRTVMSGPV